MGDMRMDLSQGWARGCPGDLGSDWKVRSSALVLALLRTLLISLQSRKSFLGTGWGECGGREVLPLQPLFCTPWEGCVPHQVSVMSPHALSCQL